MGGARPRTILARSGLIDLRRAVITSGIATMISLGPSVAEAAPGTEPEAISVTYVAADGCPDEAEFFAGLAARAHVRRSEAPAARRFAVVIDADAGGSLRGVLTVTDPDGNASTREVPGATCAEISSALQLVAALAIEERASRAAVPVRVPPAPVRAASAAPARRRPWQVTVGAGVEQYRGATPSAVLGMPVTVELGHPGGVTLRATFARTLRDELPTSAFRWTAGRLDICPFALRFARLQAGPCAGVEVGAVTSRGVGVDMATHDLRPWLAPDASLRVRASAGRFGLELEATLAVPVVRDRYYIAPDTTVHHVGPVTTALGASLTVDLF